MFRFFLTIILSTFSYVFIYAQQFPVNGTIKDSVDQEPLIGVNIILTQKNDSLKQYYAATDLSGNFTFPAIPPAEYSLQASYIGYKSFTKALKVNGKAVQLGNLFLSQAVEMMDELVIMGKIDQSTQMGDTTQFNAEAFKTAPFASGQDLVEKMPGINMLNGKIQAQGEDVQQILVDGKPFFGKDVNAALQNLPAEVIASIQVFDKKSDKAELSGFDDGQRAKTINIVTKPNRRKGQFGKTSAGYGTDDRYQVGASVNLFNNDRRTTITGLSNNINTLSYSADPNNDGESRTQDGIIKTKAIGLNFSNDWGEKIEFSASYLFNHRENEGSQYKFRDYILPSDSGQVYTEDSRSIRSHNNHHVNMRFDYKINDRNRLLIRPGVDLRHNRNSSYLFGRTTTDNGPMNQTENTANSKDTNYDFDNSIYYSHKFLKKGRSFMVSLNTGYHTNTDNAFRMAENIYYRGGTDESLNQQTKLDREGLSWRARTSYTEPIGEKGMVELEYSVSNQLNDSDKRTYNIEEQENESYHLLDTALSNTFESDYLNQELEIGYQYKTENFRMQLETEYEEVKVHNRQQFPQPFDMERTFASWLPSARIIYEFSRSKNLEFNYRTRTNSPSIGQLQNVINNSNPLHLRTGNSDLKQSYSNWMRVRYRSHDPETSRSLYTSIAASFLNNWITNSTFVAEEPTKVNDDIILEKGSQLTRPVNLDGYIAVSSYFSYSQPLDFVKLNFNVNGGIRYSKRPGQVNDELNFSNSSNFRLGVSLSSNISEMIDFNISTRGSYNIVENSLRPALDNNYYNQSTSLRGSWIFLNGFVYRANLNHQFNSGLSAGYDNSYFLVNMSLGKKFLKNDQGEISLNVYDLFEQNNNIGRSVSQLYVEDRQSTVLQRYFMLTLTYNIRHFSKGTSKDDFEDHY